MGTSRSTDAERTWTAGALVFSGRPDPSWTLPEPAARRLQALWDALDPLPGGPRVPPPLGYRGCFVACGARRLDAYRGALTLATSEVGALETREDATRAFERFVLGSAPDPALRAELLALAQLDAPAP